jgi:hypothetical protein
VWQDDFNQPAGSAPDPSRWTYDRAVINGTMPNCSATRTSVKIHVWSVDDPKATDGKALVIRAVREGTARMLDDKVFHICTPENLPNGTSWVFDYAAFFLILNGDGRTLAR